MSNKTQLQTNNTNLVSYTDRVSALIDVANSLPEAGGSGGFILNKFDESVLDATHVASSQNNIIIHTYNTSKRIVHCWFGVFLSNNLQYQNETGMSVYIGINRYIATYTFLGNTIDIKVTTTPGELDVSASDMPYTVYLMVIAEDGSIDYDIITVKNPVYICYTKNTKITLSNGASKVVQDITYDDELLVWDFDNARYTYAKPIWIKKAEKALYYYHCVFGNGIELDLVGSDGNCHAVFCLDDNKFEYANNCVGKMVMTNKGETKLLSCELKYETVEFYNIITDYHMNCYANDVLTSTKLNNIYPIEDMKFIKENRDIVTYEVYSEIPIEFYNGLRLGEHKLEDADWIIESVKTKLSKTLKYTI